MKRIRSTAVLVGAFLVLPNHLAGAHKRLAPPLRRTLSTTTKKWSAATNLFPPGRMPLTTRLADCAAYKQLSSNQHFFQRGEILHLALTTACAYLTKYQGYMVDEHDVLAAVKKALDTDLPDWAQHAGHIEAVRGCTTDAMLRQHRLLQNAAASKTFFVVPEELIKNRNNNAACHERMLSMPGGKELLARAHSIASRYLRERAGSFVGEGALYKHVVSCLDRQKPDWAEPFGVREGYEVATTSMHHVVYNVLSSYYHALLEPPHAD